MRTSGGRAATAPIVAAVRPLHVDPGFVSYMTAEAMRAAVDSYPAGREPSAAAGRLREAADADQWLETPTQCVRVHRAGRSCVFTPPRVAGIPPNKALVAVRITEGCYIDNGEKFKRVDNWKGRTAHQSMPRRWTGTTTFMRVSLCRVRISFFFEYCPRPCDKP